MKKHRYKFSFFVTALLYALPLLIYLYFFKHTVISMETPREKTLELSLSQFVPKSPPIVSPEPVQKEQLVEEKPEPEKKIEKEPEPIEKPEEKKQPPKEEAPPVVRETPVPEPVKKAAKKTHRKIVKKAEKKNKKHKKRRRVQRKRKVSGGGSQHYTAAQKNIFLARIREKINRAKSYPRIAQRRGMQGVVRVHFTILKNGHVGNIRLTGPKVFHASATKAIESAFPVNTGHVPVSLPITVKLTLHYRLR